MRKKYSRARINRRLHRRVKLEAKKNGFWLWGYFERMIKIGLKENGKYSILKNIDID